MGTMLSFCTLLCGVLFDILATAAVINIKCLRNCHQNKTNPTESFSLGFDLESISEADCPVCYDPQTNFSYLWELNSSNPDVNLTWGKESTTGNNHAAIAIRKYVFKDLSSFSFILHVYYSTVHKPSPRLLGSGSFNVHVHKLPQVKGCTVQPPEGKAFETIFTIACEQVNETEDSEQQLSYMYKALIKNEYVIFHYADQAIANMTIPVGDPKNDYSVKIAVIACNKNEVCVTNYVTVKVAAKITLKDLKKLIVGGNSTLVELIKSDNKSFALSLIARTFALLNTKETFLDDKKEVAHLRENLLEKLVSLSVTPNLNTVQQTASVLRQVTRGREKDVNEHTQQRVTEFLLQISSSMNEMEVTDVSAENLETIYEDVIHSISNVMSSIGLQYKKKVLVVSDEDVRNQTILSLSALEKANMVMTKVLVPLDEHVIVKTDTFSVKIFKYFGYNLPCISGIQFSLPCSLPIHGMDRRHEYSVKAVSFNENPYLWTKREISSSVLSLDVKSNKNKSVRFRKLEDQVKVNLDLNLNMEFQHNNLTNRKSAYVFLTNIKADEVPYIVVRTAMYLPSSESPFKMYLRTKDMLDKKGRVDVNNLGDPFPLRYTGEPNTYDAILPSGQDFYMVIFMLNSSTHDYIYYEYMMSQLRCVFWNSNNWSTEGCMPHMVKNLSVLQCACNHLSSFAANLFVLPNPVDYADVVQFLTIWKNPIGLIAVCFQLAIYIPATIWARWKDKQRSRGRRAVDLVDNDPFDKYKYTVVIQTGNKGRKAPSSTVCIILHGTLSESDPHALRCSTHPILQPDSVNFFVVRTPQSLGTIKAITLWHDAQGDYPHWYVSLCLVYDPQEDKKWTFKCDRWLSLEKGDGTRKKTFDIADTPSSLHTIVLSNTSHKIKDEHLYLSLFKVSIESNFTVCQRVACCLCIFMLGMITNIMFFGIEPTPHAYEFNWGVVSFTTQHLMISFETALIMIPSAMIICEMFQSCRPRHPIYIGKEAIDPQDIPIELRKHSTTTSPSAKDMQASKSKSKQRMKTDPPTPNRMSLVLNAEALSRWYAAVKGTYQEIPDDGAASTGKVTLVVKRKQRGCSLPWWFVYISWLILWLINGICAFYTILYCFNFGYDKSVQWIMSVLISQLIDIVALDPLKIILLATIMTCYYRKYYIEQLEEIHYIVEEDEEALTTRLTSSEAPHSSDLAQQIPDTDDAYKLVMRAIAANKRKSLKDDGAMQKMSQKTMSRQQTPSSASSASTVGTTGSPSRKLSPT